MVMQCSACHSHKCTLAPSLNKKVKFLTGLKRPFACFITNCVHISFSLESDTRRQKSWISVRNFMSSKLINLGHTRANNDEITPYQKLFDNYIYYSELVLPVLSTDPKAEKCLQGARKGIWSNFQTLRILASYELKIRPPWHIWPDNLITGESFKDAIVLQLSGKM